MEREFIGASGHRYDPEVLTAYAEIVRIREAEARAWLSRGSMTPPDAQRRTFLLRVMRYRAADVHHLVRRLSEGAVCSCGLLIPRDLMTGSVGHLDIDNCAPARAFLVDDDGLAAYCQACDWTVEVSEATSGLALAGSHACTDDQAAIDRLYVELVDGYDVGVLEDD